MTPLESIGRRVSHESRSMPRAENTGKSLLANLLPATIGDIIGAAGIIGLMNRFVYLRNEEALAPNFGSRHTWACLQGEEHDLP
jgi:hypothetical protein